MKLYEYSVLDYAFNEACDGWPQDAETAVESIESRFGVTLTDLTERCIATAMDTSTAYQEFIQRLAALNVAQPENIREAERMAEMMDKYNAERADNDDPIENVFAAAGFTGQVYVSPKSVTVSPNRITAAYAQHEDNQCIAVSDEMIDEMVELFGFNRLDNISLAPGALAQMGLSDDDIAEITGEINFLKLRWLSLKHRFAGGGENAATA